MPKLLLVHGLKFSGKSTLAERLMDGYQYQRVKMAEPLKNMVRSLLRDAGIEGEKIEQYVEGDLKEVPIPQLGGTTSRKMMMTLGDEWRNMHGHLLWANIAAAKIEKLLSEGHRVVVDDIRYPFELETLARFNPFKWVVTRGDLHFESYDEDRHPGERPMPVEGFDCHVRNDYETKQEVWDYIDELLSIREDYERRLTEWSSLQAVRAAA